MDNSENYTKIISGLKKYNNNVYLSATIDKADGFEYYTKDIRDMINLGYLCDYKINIPIFSEDPEDMNICRHLLDTYKHIIIYCNSRKEGEKINKIMNHLKPNSADYIDCETPKLKRNDIIKRYTNGNIHFLVNVRILVEGFNAPISQGVCFVHLPKNKTTVIQIVGRCLRKHPSKTISTVILPFSSDEDSISKFLEILAKNDIRIKQSYTNKRLGGYINIDLNDCNEAKNIEYRYTQIYDNMSNLENSKEVWIKNLEELKKYINENKRKPTQSNKDKEISKLGLWISYQNQRYKNKNRCMKDIEIYNIWTEFINDYKEYFISDKNIWIKKLEEVKKYINENKKKPSRKESFTLNKWVSRQTCNYKNKIKIFIYSEIYNLWTEFVNNKEYIQYFISEKEKWIQNLEEVKKYIDEKKKRPSSTDNDLEIKRMGIWIIVQYRNHKNKNYNMKDIEINDIWTKFITDPVYNKFLLTENEKWIKNLEEVKKYIDENKRTPSQSDKDKEISKMGAWISYQNSHYKHKNRCMEDIEIYDLWTVFINEYSEYFISAKDIWIKNLEEIKKYIDDNKKKPSKLDNEKYIISLYYWLSNNNHSYINKIDIMEKDTEIYNLYRDFINDPKYKEYFISDEEKWIKNLEEVKKFINENKRKPTETDKNCEVSKLALWLSKQQYKNKEGNITDIKINGKWNEFINDPSYKEYLLTENEKWYNNLNNVKEYINHNNNKPSWSNPNKNISTLGRWINSQTKNYKNKIHIMKNDEVIYNTWADFINDPKYKLYFQSDDEIWLKNLEEVKIYITKNKKTPSHGSKIKTVSSIGSWFYRQNKNYKKGEKLMENDIINGKWIEFINDPRYKSYFQSDE